MRRICIVLAALAVTLAASLSFISRVGAQPPGGPGGRPPMGMMGMPVDSFATERDSVVKDLLAHDYAGEESMPAESVFKNIKVMKGRTVEQVLRAMNMGFGRSLGVSCRHCHVLGHWADEDKPTKQVARDMMAMSQRINEELLPAIKNLKSEKPGVNCGTCHHGAARPGIGPMNRGPGGPAPGGNR